MLDHTTLLQAAQALIPAVASGVALSVGAEAAEKAPNAVIPYDPQTAAGKRLAIAVASLVVGAGLVALGADPAAFNLNDAALSAAEALFVYLGAVATHDHVLASK